MRHRVRSVGLHEQRQLETSRGAAKEWLSDLEVAQREREIAALPTIQWAGRTLYTIRCAGSYGNGPHVVNVPESLLWSLIDVNHFLCAFHR